MLGGTLYLAAQKSRNDNQETLPHLKMYQPFNKYKASAWIISVRV